MGGAHLGNGWGHPCLRSIPTKSLSEWQVKGREGSAGVGWGGGEADAREQLQPGNHKSHTPTPSFALLLKHKMGKTQPTSENEHEKKKKKKKKSVTGPFRYLFPYRTPFQRELPPQTKCQAQPRAGKEQMLSPGGCVCHCLIPEEHWRSKGGKLYGLLCPLESSSQIGPFLQFEVEKRKSTLSSFSLEVGSYLKGHHLSRKCHVNYISHAFL